MAKAPVVVNYVPNGDDWDIVVRVDEVERAAQAPGLIAARDRADQIVEELAGDAGQRTVVHLLAGDALAFTTAYLHAQHTAMTLGGEKPAEAEEAPAATDAESDGATDADAATEAAPEADAAREKADA
ncbi:hypothetical protein LX15_005486 [Streptoalloteichus tenebrarius]|uniref:Uncharacterized protein n=1 Tax=Streptoalloteichus tenebrarius (strain ATCC 17920 / DSM 40477 / JCM 4838 / CBS 697.72 / NBRC 16177 / NCIMB 11028 / NRRL B-12390 / A12253. 1 / ISP 5477) TaxID=1933 RepID=A0ABT1I1Y3_STRSD|nr:hypothetical protein [Streptoalloteichus tenebrarius]MCP2261760.1 hypothetical protein [Streptoalloteichus tenebrarius]BFF00816.1 hypothetical protein GCM10020241_24910 [Streptoalloteichus tenebrarius]